MNKKVIDTLFFLIGFGMIFNKVPKLIQPPWIGGPLSDKIVFGPIIVGLVYSLYCQFKYKNVFVNFSIFKKFLASYSSLLFISLIVGLYYYPYYGQILSGPYDQIAKSSEVLIFFNSIGINIEKKSLLTIFMFLKPIKDLMLEILYTFCFSYMVYCWYHERWQVGLKILFVSILSSLAVILVYSTVEVLYLGGNEYAKKVLAIITPYFHAIKNNPWWPPLFWPQKQLRSVFAEPSYFGIYIAFALPFLWYQFVKYKKLAFCVLIAAITFLLFLTQTRTSFMLLAGQLFVFSLMVICFLRETIYFKRSIAILVCTCFSFFGAVLFIDNCITPQTKTIKSTKQIQQITKSTKQFANHPVGPKKSMEAYVKNNASSLVNINQRSNRARYSVMEADLKIGVDNLILGVGSGLRNAYIPDYLPKAAFKVSEVRMWLDFKKKLGTLKFNIPRLGEYTSRFAETGILGLCAFLYPALILLINLLKNIKSRLPDDSVMYILFLVSFIGVMASGIGDNINITHCYWVLLGLGYAICFGRKYEVIDNE